MAKHVEQVLNVERNGDYFSDTSLQGLQKIMTEKVYTQGTNIFLEGDKSDLFYFIKDGTVRLTKTSDDGTDLDLYYFFPGDFFGELEPKGEGKCVFTAEAMTRVVLGVIHQKDLEWLLYQNGEFAVEYAKWLSGMQHYTQYKLRDLVFHGKNGALASVIIRMANTYGVKDADEYLITRKFTNSEMAGLIGATRETVNRMLSKMKKDGLIADDGGRIRILNIDELRKVCHCEGCPNLICRL